MKIFNKILLLSAAVVLSAACTKLDLVPESDLVLDSQKDPSMIVSDVNALNSVLIYCGADDTDWHFDFGYPSLCIAFDSAGADMPCATQTFNHYYHDASFENRLVSGNNMEFGWRTFYRYILAANTVIQALKDNTEALEEERNLYLGYAYAARAFGYFNLVQLHAFNYASLTDPSAVRAVPIITEDTTAEEMENNPCASVEAVYAMILSDFDKALPLLEAENVKSRPNKSYINASVAYGIRARVNLAMHKYAEAAADANKARSLATGVAFLTNQEVSTPGFNDAGVSSCMWAAMVSTTSRAVTTGICNWPSMLCSLVPGGYVSVGSLRRINQPLWDLIPDDDVRKGWWVDQNLSSPLVDDITYGGRTIAAYMRYVPYTNVKFHAYNNEIGSVNASDWMMMRLEEMLLIEAEGLAMSNDLPGGQALLNSWLSTYRQTGGYTSTATTPEEFQNEVWFQRRIELWGEGHSWFDIMRLGKNVVRVANGTNTTFIESLSFNVASNDNVMVWLIPTKEIDPNRGIDYDINHNPVIPKSGDRLELRDGIIW